MRQYEFGGTDFWEIICPSLKEGGWLESFEDPNIVSGPNDYYERFPSYKKLKEKIRRLNDTLLPGYSFAKFFNKDMTAENV